MTVEKLDPVGAQPGDPAWVRLLFVLVEGRDGQCWRAVLLLTPLLVLIGVMAAVPPAGWVGGALGVGWLSAALARRRRQR